jgi:hypothetical protein
MLPGNAKRDHAMSAAARRVARRPPCAVSDRPARRAVALLEVVLALALFFGIAVTVLGGLSVCLRSAVQVREEAKAADLAVTVLSELQMQVLPLVDAGPTPFEDPDADWAWQTVITPVDTVVPGLEQVQVEVIVTNIADGYAFRLFQLFPGTEEDLVGTAGGATDMGESP